MKIHRLFTLFIAYEAAEWCLQVGVDMVNAVDAPSSLLLDEDVFRAGGSSQPISASLSFDSGITVKPGLTAADEVAGSLY